MLNKLLLSAVIPLSLFSFELNFSKKFSQEITPDILTTRISLSVQNKDERFATDNLESINDYIKSSQNIIFKNGYFNLTPKYSYRNQNRIFLGYLGNLSYTITSKNANSMNEFLSELVEEKTQLKDKSIKLNINNTRWKISEVKYNNAKDTLRLICINWIERYARELKKSCTVKKININNTKDNFIRNDIQIMSRSTMKVVPEKSSKSISINPHFTLECR